MLWAATTYITVERGGASELTGQAWAILTLLAMVVVSFVILRRVTDEKRDWDALRSADEIVQPRDSHQARIARIDSEPAIIHCHVRQHAPQPSRPPLIGTLHPVHGLAPFAEFGVRVGDPVSDVAPHVVEERVVRLRLTQESVQFAPEVVADGACSALADGFRLEEIRAFPLTCEAHPRASNLEGQIELAESGVRALQPLERRTIPWQQADGALQHVNSFGVSPGCQERVAEGIPQGRGIRRARRGCARRRHGILGAAEDFVHDAQQPQRLGLGRIKLDGTADVPCGRVEIVVVVQRHLSNRAVHFSAAIVNRERGVNQLATPLDGLVPGRDTVGPLDREQVAHCT